MRNRNLLALAATALIAYSGTVFAQANCANLPGLLLTIKQYSIDLNDKMPVCIAVPGEFDIRINTPPGGGVTVSAGQVTAKEKVKKGQPTVLIQGDNSSPVNKLTIRVTAVEGKKFEKDDEFEYLIDIVDVGELDPRIRVINSN